MATMNRNNMRANTLPVDPDVIVPEAVRRAAAAAEAAQQRSNPTSPAPSQDPPAPPADTIRIAEPPVPPKVTTVTTEPAPPAPENPQPPTPPVPQVDEATWKGRVQALRNTVNEQAARITTLENMLATQQAAPPQAPTPPAPLKLLTDKEIEDFGPEMIDMVRRAARETYEPLVNDMKAHITNLEGQLGRTSNTVETNSRSAMLSKLDEQLPEWHDINVHPDFHAWLSLPDPFSGVTRKKLLTAAYDGNKATQVLAFFKGFVSELAATTPALVQDPPEPPPAATAPQRPTLEQLAAPGRARAAPAAQAPSAEKQIIYTSDINKFYADKRNGKYIGREDEFRQHELELEKAIREGRVVTNT